MTRTNHKISLVTLARMLRDAFKELNKNDPLQMAGATAFFTTFALPPILIIIIQVLGLVFNPEKISQQLFEKLSDVIGPSSVHQIIETLTAFRKLAYNWFVTITGFIFLAFVATTLFKVIKGSLNQVWRIKRSGKSSLWFNLRTRFQSVLVILVAAILFVIGLLTAAVQAFLGKYIFLLSPELSFYFTSGLNYIVSVMMVMLWFAIVFRYLPDGRPVWKVALTGALVTSILFNTGKLILHWLLSKSNIIALYGASASIVLLLLFVFYSSLIMYYGAAFTKIWGAYHNKPIMPLPHAMNYKLLDEIPSSFH